MTTVSPQFENLVRFLSEKKEDHLCSLCYALKKNLQICTQDPMIGKICPECQKEMDIHSEESEKAIPLVRGGRCSKRGPSPLIPPEKCKAIKWMVEMVLASKTSLPVADLIAAMDKKGYSPNTKNTQFGRIRKAFYTTDTLIYVQPPK